MANIHIERSHNLGLEDARSKVEQLAESLKEDLQIDYEWSGDRLVFERFGASGSIVVSADKIDLDIELGMVLALMKDNIEEGVNRRLDAVLG
ncbi:MAG: polyhydroxyalkanoic acid system family protein [Chromatiaceae bacterium]|nr:polyhydroxyalkanoic acid system family protein [Chromatiaceae bacterium]